MEEKILVGTHQVGDITIIEIEVFISHIFHKSFLSASVTVYLYNIPGGKSLKLINPVSSRASRSKEMFIWA